MALRRYDDSLLRQRCRLIQRAAGEKTVVYLGDDLRLGHLLGGDCQRQRRERPAETTIIACLTNPA